MKLITVVTPPPDICNGCYTWKKFWEVNFTPVNVTSCGRRNVMKHREIKEGEQYTDLEIYLKLDCMDKMEFTS